MSDALRHAISSVVLSWRSEGGLNERDVPVDFGCGARLRGFRAAGIRSDRAEAWRSGARLLAPGNRRQDPLAVADEGPLGRARVVSEGVHRRLNGRMQLAP